MEIFDAHFHITNYNFPLVGNNGYLPPEYTINDYQISVSEFELIGGAIVSGSFQAFDQTYIIHALARLGPNFVGVANITEDISQEKLIKLDKAGVTAVRFNIVRGSSKQLDSMIERSNRLYEEFGWHLELYIKNDTLNNDWGILQQLPSFSIDHLGLTKDGISTLLELGDHGVKVRATGFGRANFNPISLMKQIYAINSQALLFGTDLPSTRAGLPFSQKDVYSIKTHFSKHQQEQIFYRNAVQWYRRN